MKRVIVVIVIGTAIIFYLLLISKDEGRENFRGPQEPPAIKGPTEPPPHENN